MCGYDGMARSVSPPRAGLTAFTATEGSGMFTTTLEEQQLAMDEEFAAWLAQFRDRLPGGMLACHFLSAEHLRAAWAAGWRAATVSPASARS
jgi:hypothetical protein